MRRTGKTKEHHLGKGWKTVPTPSYLSTPKKARGKEGFPSYAFGKTYYTYNTKKKKK